MEVGGEPAGTRGKWRTRVDGGSAPPVFHLLMGSSAATKTHSLCWNLDAKYDHRRMLNNDLPWLALPAAEAMSAKSIVLGTATNTLQRRIPLSFSAPFSCSLIQLVLQKRMTVILYHRFARLARQRTPSSLGTCKWPFSSPRMVRIITSCTSLLRQLTSSFGSHGVLFLTTSTVA